MSKVDKVEKAYTIIELIITIAIISIILAIGIPKFKISTFSLRPSGIKLCQEIRNIRLINMTEDTLYCIIIKKDRYSIKRGIEILKTEYLDSNLRLSDNFNDDALEYSTIHFNHNGAPSYAGTIKIKDIDSGKYMEITITPVTGRVLLRDEIFKE